MDGRCLCKCDISSLSCAAQKTTLCACALLSMSLRLSVGNEEGDIILEPLKVGACMLLSLTRYLIVLTEALN